MAEDLSQYTPEQIKQLRAEWYDGARRSALEQGFLADNLKYTDPSSDPRYADMLRQLEGYAHGTLTPEDRAREYEALGQAQQFAQGQQGAISQDAAARGGGGAGVNSVRQQVAAQGAATRLGSADVATSGMASQRALSAQQEFARQMQINSEMQNQFAMQKAGMQEGALVRMQALQEAEAEQRQQFIGNAVKGFANFAIGAPGLTGAGGPVPSIPQIQPGAGAMGNAGVMLPGAKNSTFGAAPSIQGPDSSAGTFDSGGLTASAAAKAYAESLHPFGDVPTPGSAPSSSSRGPDYGNINDPTLPRKPVIPSFN